MAVARVVRYLDPYIGRLAIDVFLGASDVECSDSFLGLIAGVRLAGYQSTSLKQSLSRMSVWEAVTSLGGGGFVRVTPREIYDAVIADAYAEKVNLRDGTPVHFFVQDEVVGLVHVLAKWGWCGQKQSWSLDVANSTGLIEPGDRIVVPKFVVDVVIYGRDEP